MCYMQSATCIPENLHYLITQVHVYRALKSLNDFLSRKKNSEVSILKSNNGIVNFIILGSAAE